MANNQDPVRREFLGGRESGEGERGGHSNRLNGAAPGDLGSFVLNGRRFVVYPPGVDGAEEPPSPSVGTLLLEGQRCRIVEELEHPPRSERDPAEVLTARELQIAALVAHGHCTKRIAHHLRISEWTVQTHLRRSYAKLGVAGRTEMVFRCAKRLEL
jgi:DNA-binding CsgD family transcriptional regulator